MEKEHLAAKPIPFPAVLSTWWMKSTFSLNLKVAFMVRLLDANSMSKCTYPLLSYFLYIQVRPEIWGWWKLCERVRYSLDTIHCAHLKEQVWRYSIFFLPCTNSMRTSKPSINAWMQLTSVLITDNFFSIVVACSFITMKTGKTVYFESISQTPSCGCKYSVVHHVCSLKWSNSKCTIYSCLRDIYLKLQCPAVKADINEQHES